MDGNKQWAKKTTGEMPELLPKLATGQVSTVTITVTTTVHGVCVVDLIVSWLYLMGGGREAEL